MGRFDGKTEKATPQRRRESRGEGQVARSQELAVAASLLAAMFTLRIVAPASIRVFDGEARLLFSAPSTGELPTALIMRSLGRVLTAGIGPFLVVAVVVGIAVNVAQVGFKVTPKAARPKLNRVSPKQGFEKLRPSNAAWEVGRTFLKVIALFAVAWPTLREATIGITTAWSLTAGISAVVDGMIGLIARAFGVMLVIGAADYVVNRRRHERQMKMSKQDVREEHKRQEGDPLIRSARRRRAQELTRNRMLASVATADVVVTNPTHFAVAIQYRDEDGAPKVVAKGTERLAKRIRREAYRHGVMVLEDRPLARSLYRRVTVGNYVPGDLYEAVATVLAIVYRKRTRRPVVA